MCLPFRNGAFDAIKSAAALSLIPLPLRTAVRWKGLHSRNHLTAKLAKRWLFYECQQFHRTWCSTQESGGSSACNREARCKKVVLGFPAEPCKANTAGTPPDEPKSRKMHQCEHVEKYARLPSFPRIKARFQRAASEPFGTPFFNIFRRATKDIAAGGTSGWMPYQSRLKRSS